MNRRDKSPVLAVAAVSALLFSSASWAGPVSAIVSPPGPSIVEVDHVHEAATKRLQAKTDRYEPATCATLTAAQRNSPVPHARCYALEYTAAAEKSLSSDSGPPSTATTPEEFQEAYNLPDGGAGSTVAIMTAFGYSTAEEDLAVYRDYYGLPPCTSENGCFTTIDQRGGTDFPSDDAGWSVEAAMDMDAVSAVCPSCNILLVQADSNSFDDLGKAVDTAAEQPGVVAISNSYGVDGENPRQTQYEHYFDHPGIAVVVSSGDLGNVQSWPATNPTVVAVGGTNLVQDDSERGWHESAWGSPVGGDGAGSGCSLYEPQPEWQQDVDTTCADHKASADISADADPATGIAVYNTIGQSGWGQWGGTSLSAPLVAGMYGLAGTPTPDTYPVSYAYANTDALFDVSDGANGSCGTKLCEAGPGWDGPTGLGTPNGIAALRQADGGQVVGTVTVSDSGHPLGGVSVTAVDAAGNEFPTVSDGDGTYNIYAPAGTYAVTASKFGYRSTVTDGVRVEVGEQVTTDFTMVEKETQTVAGYVTDGSGHGWPMRAKITVEGHPDVWVLSDPYTGRYQLSLPRGQSYTLHATTADLPGYQTQEATVDLSGEQLVATHPHNLAHAKAQTNDWHHGQAKGHEGKISPALLRTDISLDVDRSTCTAPGYAYTYNGLGTAFEGWTGNEPQDGWTIVDNQGNGQTWRFDDPGNRGNLTGGSGNFAIIDSGAYGPAKHQDTSLISPVTDLSDVNSPTIDFDSDYEDWLGDSASVDVSIDGGRTWTTVWHKADHGIFTGHVEIPIPNAANQPDVRVRFHYIGFYSWWWEIDNVVIGNGRSCEPIAGGLVIGSVTDHNTGDPVNGATVTSHVNEGEFGVTTKTPEDANLPDGYFWLFSSHTGPTDFSASKGQYSPVSETVDVAADYVRHNDLELRAGHLVVDTSSIQITERMGRARSQAVTFGNDGTEPVHVQLGEAVGGFTALNGHHLRTAPGAPKHVVKTPTSVAALVGETEQASTFAGPAKHSQSRTVHGQSFHLQRPSPAGDAWSPIADYPKPVMDNAVAYHSGNVYVLGGSDGSSTYSEVYVYEPSSRSWSAIADLPEPLSAASAVFMDDTLYLVGGWDTGASVSSHAYAYNPDSDSWTQLADMPGSVSAAGLAALQGKLYVVGGCTNGNCTSSADSVYSYSPGSNTWSEEPAYPMPVSFTACGGIGGEVVCAGGVNSSTSLSATYALVPGSGSWTQKAELPVDAWAASYAAANGKLEVMGGAINNGHEITNQGYVYDPATDQWDALPNSNNAVYRGGAACGLFKVGGFTGYNPAAFGETLPGYENCGSSSDVTWLSESKTEFDVAPGDSVTVTMTLDSDAVSKPGDYMAKASVSTDTPYRVKPMDVVMHVQPPSAWGKIAGTVTDAEGNRLPGATVHICTMWDRYLGCGEVTYTLKTDDNGHYQLWLSRGYNPLAIIAAKDGYQPAFQVTKVHGGETTTVNFALHKT